MDIQIVAATTSIANCLQIVKDLRNDGIAKEDLLVITNLTTREIIFNNHNLRQSDGSVFSSHSLIQNVKHILNRQRNLMRFRCRQDKDNILRWLFQGLQQCIKCTS